jgi:hypothetical protein
LPKISNLEKIWDCLKLGFKALKRWLFSAAMAYGRAWRPKPVFTVDTNLVNGLANWAMAAR